MIKDTDMSNEILKEYVDSLIAKSNAKTSDELITLRDSVINSISDYFNNHITPNNSPLDFISSDEVTLEVKDKDTNMFFRRTLEISYIENSNGLKLKGEDLNGQPSEIVFLSDTAINKIIDVTGKGLNKSRCHD